MTPFAAELSGEWPLHRSPRPESTLWPSRETTSPSPDSVSSSAGASGHPLTLSPSIFPSPRPRSINTCSLQDGVRSERSPSYPGPSEGEAPCIQQMPVKKTASPAGVCTYRSLQRKIMMAYCGHFEGGFQLICLHVWNMMEYELNGRVKECPELSWVLSLTGCACLFLL